MAAHVEVMDESEVEGVEGLLGLAPDGVEVVDRMVNPSRATLWVIEASDERLIWDPPGGSMVRISSERGLAQPVPMDVPREWPKAGEPWRWVEKVPGVADDDPWGQARPHEVEVLRVTGVDL